MAWRRVEDSHSVRAATYTKMEKLLNLQFGSLRRALGDDAQMVDLLQAIDIGFNPPPGDPADVVASFARSVLDQQDVKPSTRARLSSVVVRDPLPGEAEAMRTNWAPPDSDLGLASRLIERMTRRPNSPRLDAAVDALLAAMPELVDRRQQ